MGKAAKRSRGDADWESLRVRAELLKEIATALAQIAQVFLDANPDETTAADRQRLGKASKLVGRAIDLFETPS